MKLHKCTLSQMLDLALCTPEPGAVNFNILHAVILSLLKQLGIQELKPWSESDKPAALQSLLLTHRQDLQRLKRASSDTQLRPAARSTGDLSAAEVKEVDDEEESTEEWRPPTTEEIRQATRKVADPSEKSKIISQMWQSTNLLKRVDATEDGIDKLSSMMDSFLDEFENLNHVVMEEMKPQFDEYFLGGGMQKFREKVDLLEEAVDALETDKADLKEHKKLSQFVEDLKTLSDALVESMSRKLDKEEFLAELDSLKEKLDLCDKLLVMIPDKVSELESKYQEMNGQVSFNKERLDSVAQDLLHVMEQMESFSESSALQEKLLDILEKIRKFQTEIDELNRATATLIGDSSSRQMALEDLQYHLDQLRTSKADKDDVYDILSKKADLDLVDGKVGHPEFSDITSEIKTQLKTLLARLISNEEHLTKSIEEMMADVANKLSCDDFEHLQAPIKDNLKSLWAKLRQLRRLLNESLNPSAAGVTKCLSCGRPAKLAGRDIAISGGPDGMHQPDYSRRSLDVRGVSPYDPDSAATSVISLPDNSLRKEVDLIGYDGRYYKGTVDVKHHETDDRDLNFSVIYARDGTPEILSRPASNAKSASQVSVGWSSVASGRHYKKPKQARREEDKYFSKTRYVGGKHTVGKPSQKGAIHSKFLVPKRKSREHIGLMGYDKQMYHGVVKPRPPKDVDNEEEDVDVESEDVTSMPSTSRGRRKKSMESRFCGGRHTVTKPNQRGLIYSKMTLEEEPWEKDTYLLGSDKNVYRGLEYKDPSEVQSDSSGRKSKTRVDLVGSDGRVVKGCIVQLPPEQLKMAKKERGSRKNIFFSATNTFNL